MDPSKHRALIVQLQKEYLSGFKEKFKRIMEFHQKKNWQALELEYHNLKGTGTTYGIPEVTELCRYMERLCRKNKEVKKEWLEISIKLLEKISDKYGDKKPFTLSTDPDFVKVKSLCLNKNRGSCS